MATRVAFEHPQDETPLATIALFNLESEPLDIVEVRRCAGESVAFFSGVAGASADRGVRIHEGPTLPALLDAARREGALVPPAASRRGGK